MNKEMVLVNIDTLFDTFFGAVIQCNKNWAIPLVRAGYLKRKHNTLSLLLPDINDEQIQEVYENRNIELLRLTKQTFIPHLLGKYFSETSPYTSTDPEAISYGVTINTYPYNFTKSELITLFQCLKLKLNVDTLLRIHAPLKDLTPSYIKANYNRIVIYSLHDWLGLHLRELGIPGNAMPEVTVTAPRCFCKGAELEGEAHDDDIIIKHVRTGFMQHFDLDLVDLADMSFFIPPTTKEED